MAREKSGSYRLPQRRATIVALTTTTGARPTPAMNDSQRDYDVFEAGDIRLQSHMVFRGARLAYKIYGKLNAERSNAILFMTPFGAHHTDIAWMIKPGAAWIRSAIASSFPICSAMAFHRRPATRSRPSTAAAGRISPRPTT